MISVNEEATTRTRDEEEGRRKGLNPTPHLNRARVRAYALEVARQTRGQGFERVGASFLLRIEEAVKGAIRNEVRVHPSKGKTLL